MRAPSSSSTRSASTARSTSHDAEVAFWAALTGWPWVDVDEPELSGCARPAGIPFRLLFQRLGEPTGPVRAHADLACADREASLARHLAAGARVVEVRDGWTVMADPVGRVYCLTDRSPTAPPGLAGGRDRGSGRVGQREAEQRVLDDLGEGRVDPVLPARHVDGRAARRSPPGRAAG